MFPRDASVVISSIAVVVLLLAHGPTATDAWTHPYYQSKQWLQSQNNDRSGNAQTTTTTTTTPSPQNSFLNNLLNKPSIYGGIDDRSGVSTKLKTTNDDRISDSNGQPNTNRASHLSYFNGNNVNQPSIPSDRTSSGNSVSDWLARMRSKSTAYTGNQDRSSNTGTGSNPSVKVTDNGSVVISLKSGTEKTDESENSGADNNTTTISPAATTTEFVPPSVQDKPSDNFSEEWFNHKRENYTGEETHDNYTSHESTVPPKQTGGDDKDVAASDSNEQPPKPSSEDGESSTPSVEKSQSTSTPSVEDSVSTSTPSVEELASTSTQSVQESPESTSSVAAANEVPVIKALDPVDAVPDVDETEASCNTPNLFGTCDYYTKCFATVQAACSTQTTFLGNDLIEWCKSMESLNQISSTDPQLKEYLTTVQTCVNNNLAQIVTSPTCDDVSRVVKTSLMETTSTSCVSGDGQYCKLIADTTASSELLDGYLKEQPAKGLKRSVMLNMAQSALQCPELNGIGNFVVKLLAAITGSPLESLCSTTVQ